MTISASHGGSSTGVLNVIRSGPILASSNWRSPTSKLKRTSDEWPFFAGNEFMAGWRDAVESRARQYAEKSGREIRAELGFGYDGIVFATSCQSAIKALRYKPLYERERDVYVRLQERDVRHILGFTVPQMLHADDELWVVEMEIVSPPFVLDFAGAYLDIAPDYPEEVMQEWRAEKREQFGDRWPIVQDIMREFRKLGIYLADVKPGNIMFKD